MIYNIQVPAETVFTSRSLIPSRIADRLPDTAKQPAMFKFRPSYKPDTSKPQTSHEYVLTLWHNRWWGWNALAHKTRGLQELGHHVQNFTIKFKVESSSPRRNKEGAARAHTSTGSYTV